MKTKYFVILCDGMSDLPCKELGNKTPMTVAKKPNMNALASTSILGLSKTVPDDFPPGSDVANLSVLGYNPSEFYTGRSPFEAASIGVEMEDDDVAIRVNLVKLSVLSDGKDFREAKMVSYCADDIKTKPAGEIIKLVNEKLGNDEFKFYKGTDYRHCLIWKGGKTELNLTPPHDITGKRIAEHVKPNDNNRKLLDIMEKSYTILRGQKANCVWFWGEGKKAKLPPFKAKTGKEACMISAVDLLRGMGQIAGMQVIKVDGTTGYIDTNFVGEAEAALNFIKSGGDLAYIHIEAPDECAHRGEIANKVKSIELIDKLVLGTILKAYQNGELTINGGVNEKGEQLPDEEVRIKILITPDHATPLSLKTHTSEPVPFLIYDSGFQRKSNVKIFDENTAKATKILLEEGHQLMERFLAD
ncbi:MAG: cofactor-independent phosphoglycerate mutase [Oscillospiraceae bacterium]|nr:cofactor-independent phosphoglycerate mutase [Oscillospiraceae bacterium]